MPRTVNLIKQIIEVRERRDTGFAISELFLRLIDLEKAFKERENLSPEFLKYFPVGLVACLEGYFRLEIKQIIDFGSPYLERSEKLLSNGKFDFESIKARHGKQITLGELVAHQIPISNLDRVCSHLSALMGKDFLQELRQVHDRWAYEVKKQPKEPILKDPDAVYAGVAKTFELRHIICHELATRYEFKLEEIEHCFFSTTLFLKASESLIREMLFPGAPLTQSAKNVEAFEESQGYLKEIEKLNLQIIEIIGQERGEDYSKSATAWYAYLESWANFEANENKGRNYMANHL